MAKPTVAISVDCVCAAQGKCYVSEVVAVAEQFKIPLTWLLGVAEHDPLSNVKLYHNEYFHRIPAWHELGLYLTFDTSAGNTVERGDLIRIGKDILKQFSIKPTAFRAANGDLEAGDVRALEDIGILVDSTPAPVRAVRWMLRKRPTIPLIHRSTIPAMPVSGSSPSPMSAARAATSTTALTGSNPSSTPLWPNRRS